MRFDICISSVICQICQDRITNFPKIAVALHNINSNLELGYDPSRGHVYGVRGQISCQEGGGIVGMQHCP